MSNFIVYDIEIWKAIPTDEPPVPGIQYCEGWNDKANMGISVICVYDYIVSTYYTFTPHTGFEGFQNLINMADLVIGFNSESFDDQVCGFNNIQVKTGYDILRETYIAKGLNPYPEVFGPEYRGYGLNALASANGFGNKTGHGALAPVLWQQGRKQEVIDYCINDVRLTKELMDRIIAGKPLIDPVNGQNLYLRKPKGRK